MYNGDNGKPERNAFFLLIGTTGPDVYFDSLESLNLDLLEIIGIGYVIDHYISYFHKEQKEKAYKIYVTDVLKLLSENTAKYTGGSYISVRFIEMLNPPKEETRTPEEIINDIRSKLSGG